MRRRVEKLRDFPDATPPAMWRHDGATPVAIGDGGWPRRRGRAAQRRKEAT
jgi:hypothetical protein